MHHANHFYGHAHILGKYCGIDHPPRIWGYLQHGWNMHDGFAVGTVYAKGYPKFVWSDIVARRGWAYGMRDYVTVGAPWMYLLNLERQADWVASNPTREGTIVYPFHGWEGQQVLGSHKEYIAEVKATEGDVPITVCLHWNEFNLAPVRAAYEDAGVRVITAGQRGYLWQGTTPEFLENQLREIRRHRRVVSNRMSSALMYGATAGAEIGIYGDPMALDGDHAILGGIGRPRRLWPQFHTVVAPTEEFTAMARSELGADSLLGVEEMIDTFGWRPEFEAELEIAQDVSVAVHGGGEAT